ncbi:MAG: type III pantothenate kinase [Chloroflexi bacterium]|nr:type III pantothenate kinase [Chloroflexota bacterium]
MLLCIDVGNTNIVFGVYADQQLVAHWRVATDSQKMPDEYGLQTLGFLQRVGVTPQDITGICMASVVPPVTDLMLEMLAEYVGQRPLVVGAGVRTGVAVRYDAPRDVGADRIVNAAAAYRLYGGPACIVDLGTATTFDALSEQGDYLGGAIAPGIRLGAEALFARTAKLPRIDLRRPPKAIGANTVDAMRSGILFGYVGLVEGMVGRFRQELGPEMRVIATGGLAEIIAAETSVIEHIEPWLTLKGLRIIYQLNEV